MQFLLYLGLSQHAGREYRNRIISFPTSLPIEILHYSNIGKIFTNDVAFWGQTPSSYVHLLMFDLTELKDSKQNSENFRKYFNGFGSFIISFYYCTVSVEGEQILPPHNMPLWNKVYLKPITF